MTNPFTLISNLMQQNNANPAVNNDIIGSFGDIVFNVSFDGQNIKSYTFDDMSRTLKANYASHNIHGKKQVIEFTGLEAETVSLRIRLDIFLGVDPKTEIDKVRKLLIEHTVNTLIIGGYVLGDFVIESAKEGYIKIDNKGKITVAELDLSFKEYITNAGS